MKRFEIFRSKDPQVSSWLQKNGFQNRWSNSYDENREKPVAQEPDVQTKEVRFYKDEHMHSKIPSLVFKQTIPELRSNKTEGQGRGRLKSMDDIPVIKQVVYQKKNEPTETAFNYTKGQRIRSFSTPPNNELSHAAATKCRPSLARSSSTFSLYSDRKSNIPVLIRNNNIRLRKYSCPEYYTTGTQESDQREGRELGFGRNSINVSNNTSQQLAKESIASQTTLAERKLRERNVDKRRDATAKTSFDLQTLQEENRYAKRRKDDPVRKELNESRFQVVSPATDLNANKIYPNQKGPLSDGSLTDNGDEDLRFKLYEEDSLESYSLDVQPRPLKQNFPSSMYGTRGTMLTWLGDVNRNNPQLWS